METVDMETVVYPVRLLWSVFVEHPGQLDEANNASVDRRVFFFTCVGQISLALLIRRRKGPLTKKGSAGGKARKSKDYTQRVSVFLFQVFFVVRLHPTATIPTLPPTTDPDPLVTCDLMDGRDAFLTMARERHLEFSSLRRAKFSTMALLYELYNQGQERGFVYTCNNCRANVESRYHCNTCEVCCYFRMRRGQWRL